MLLFRKVRAGVDAPGGYRRLQARYRWYLTLSVILLIVFYARSRPVRYTTPIVDKRNIFQAKVKRESTSCEVTSIRGLARPTVVITTFGRKMLDRSDKTATIFERSHWSDTALWIYHEASWDHAHGNKWNMSKLDSMIPTNTDRSRVCFFDIFEEAPWLWSVSRKSGAIDQFYGFAGFMEPCDQPLRVKSGKLLVRKLAAMNVAVSALPPSSIVVWLDSDVSFVSNSLDEEFRNFVLKHDVTFIPFTTNKQWDDVIKPNFQNSLTSPYWRIESGFLAMQVTGATKQFLEYSRKLYSGELLSLARGCLHRKSSYPYCDKIWLRRNLYLDDIYVLSLALHELYERKAIRLGWFWYGCSANCLLCPDLDIEAKPYPYPHTCYGANHVSPFYLGKYAHHWIGSGYYSSQFRTLSTQMSKLMDQEVMFEDHEMFNDTIEFRFPGSTPEMLEDVMWDCSSLLRRQQHGLWPQDSALQFGPSIRGGVSQSCNAERTSA